MSPPSLLDARCNSEAAGVLDLLRYDYGGSDGGMPLKILLPRSEVKTQTVQFVSYTNHQCEPLSRHAPDTA